MVKPPAVAARFFSGPAGLVNVNVNPKKANPNVLGRDALSCHRSISNIVDAWLAEVRLRHTRQEEA